MITRRYHASALYFRHRFSGRLLYFMTPQIIAFSRCWVPWWRLISHICSFRMAASLLYLVDRYMISAFMRILRVSSVIAFIVSTPSPDFTWYCSAIVYIFHSLHTRTHSLLRMILFIRHTGTRPIPRCLPLSAPSATSASPSTFSDAKLRSQGSFCHIRATDASAHGLFEFRAMPMLLMIDRVNARRLSFDWQDDTLAAACLALHSYWWCRSWYLLSRIYIAFASILARQLNIMPFHL